MQKKKKTRPAPARRRAGSKPRLSVRPVYDPAIREVIEGGELAEMKRLLVKARALASQQGDLEGAIKKLERAIAKLDK